MPRPLHLISISLVALALTGCCRETFREMARASVKQKPDQERRVSAERSKAVARSTSASASEIETGSVAEKEIDCQGEHLAYQATREYLKMVGPKPPSAAGDEGPCAPKTGEAAK